MEGASDCSLSPVTSLPIPPSCPNTRIRRRVVSHVPEANDTNACFLSLLILYINHISQLTPLRAKPQQYFKNMIIVFEVATWRLSLGVWAWFGLHVQSLIGLDICYFSKCYQTHSPMVTKSAMVLTKLHIRISLLLKGLYKVLCAFNENCYQ